ncbi:MAG: hypothetical protein HC853_04085, partial [Anaerolineae bacterium]|nr:hypothetical protein [Anaerolineae bacterium]
MPSLSVRDLLTALLLIIGAMNKIQKTLLRALAAVAIVAALPATNALATNTARIGDTVWNDTNGNGVQDSGEPGLPGVLVRLLNCQKLPLGSATTNSTGNYRFSALPAGCYIIAVDFPP